jgi:hypothetical protein
VGVGVVMGLFYTVWFTFSKNVTTLCSVHSHPPGAAS